jgi:hypothetical protein
VYTGFWRENVEEKRKLERPRRWWKSNIEIDLQEMGCEAGTVLFWVRIKIVGGFLWVR